MPRSLVISLGGSLLVPDAIDVAYLERFATFVRRYVQRGWKFFVVVGGGKTTRRYQDAARQIHRVTSDDLDWLGIHTTRLNAHLVRTIFRDIAHPVVLTHPTDHPRIRKRVAVAAGWRPGFSTDYIAVRLAHAYRIPTVLNLSNIRMVFARDPNHAKNAQPLPSLTWREYRRLAGTRWNPGMNSPFDPVAARLASQAKLTVVVCDGRDFKNLARYLAGKSFVGTTIRG